MLQSEYERGTKDGDVLETSHLTEDLKSELLALAGEGSEIHRRWRIHLEFVAPALPFLAVSPLWHDATGLNTRLRYLSISVLDVVDVVVSKLKRFSALDERDIEAMVRLDLVPHERLIDRFRSAVDGYSMDARAEDLPQYVANLHRIERDQLGVPPTEIELPTWVS
jgi:hypothetical protein